MALRKDQQWRRGSITLARKHILRVELVAIETRTLVAIWLDGFAHLRARSPVAWIGQLAGCAIGTQPRSIRAEAHESWCRGRIATRALALAEEAEIIGAHATLIFATGTIESVVAQFAHRQADGFVRLAVPTNSIRLPTIDHHRFGNMSTLAIAFVAAIGTLKSAVAKHLGTHQAAIGWLAIDVRSLRTFVGTNSVQLGFLLQ